MEMWGIWSKEEVRGGAEGETGAKKKKKKGVGVRGKFFLRFYLKMAFHSSESVSNLNSVL